MTCTWLRFHIQVLDFKTFSSKPEFRVCECCRVERHGFAWISEAYTVVVLPTWYFGSLRLCELDPWYAFAHLKHIHSHKQPTDVFSHWVQTFAVTTCPPPCVWSVSVYAWQIRRLFSSWAAFFLLLSLYIWVVVGVCNFGWKLIFHSSRDIYNLSMCLCCLRWIYIFVYIHSISKFLFSLQLNARNAF